MKKLILSVFVLSAVVAHAAVGDFTRTVISTKLNGWDGVQFIKWTKGSGSSAGRGWAVKFDLSKGYRLRTQFGDARRNKATVGTMAECVADAEGVTPIMGMNGDYFDTGVSYARCTGLVITDDELVTRGFTNGSASAMCYIMQTADGNLVHSAMTRHASAPSGCPTASWQVSANGKKIRQAIRTNYCNYPVKGGKINPVGGSSGGATFPTTIGNMQSRTAYPRPLIGIGTNAVGVATNLVLFVNDGRQSGWSYNFPDIDAYQIMIDEGCNEVGEFDGGGSAAMWMAFGSDSEYNITSDGYKTTHGNYVNRPCDATGPRKDACGIFVLPPKKVNDTVEVNDGNLYADVDGAFKAVAPGDTVKATAATAFAAGTIPMSCTMTAVGSAKVNCTAALSVPKDVRVVFRDVAFEKGGSAAPLTVAAGGTAAVAGSVGVAKVVTADAAGFEVAGALAADIVVDCAVAGSAGQVFGKSSLSVAEVEGSLKRIRHPSDRTLVALAVAGANGTDLIWKVGIAFADSSDAEGFNYTNRAVTVTVGSVDGEFAAGTKLRLTVSDATGAAVATLDRELKGAGVYSFDTAEATTTSIAPGKNYTYEVKVVDAGGQAIAGADAAKGSFLTATDANWFAAFAGDDSSVGGTWTVKPEIKNGVYSIVSGTTYAFNPTEAIDGIARVTIEVNFGGGYDDDKLAAICQSYEANPPQSMLTMKERDDGSLVWAGLVRANGQLEIRELLGLPATEERTYRCQQEVDYSSGTPRVSYLVAADNGELVRLSDESGAVWFAGPDTSGTKVSRVELEGVAKVNGIVGEYADKSILRVKDGTVTLLTNVILDPTTLPPGEYALVRGEKAFRWTDNGRGVVYDRQTGTIKVMSESPKNGYDSYTSYLLNLDPEDDDSKPIATFVRDEATGKMTIKLALANGEEFKPRDPSETGIAVKVVLESADNLDFLRSDMGKEIDAADFSPVIETFSGGSRFYKCHINFK